MNLKCIGMRDHFGLGGSVQHHWLRLRIISMLKQVKRRGAIAGGKPQTTHHCCIAPSDERFSIHEHLCCPFAPMKRNEPGRIYCTKEAANARCDSGVGCLIPRALST